MAQLRTDRNYRFRRSLPEHDVERKMSRVVPCEFDFRGVRFSHLLAD